MKCSRRFTASAILLVDPQYTAFGPVQIPCMHNRSRYKVEPDGEASAAARPAARAVAHAMPRHFVQSVIGE